MGGRGVDLTALMLVMADQNSGFPGHEFARHSDVSLTCRGQGAEHEPHVKSLCSLHRSGFETSEGFLLGVEFRSFSFGFVQLLCRSITRNPCEVEEDSEEEEEDCLRLA